MTPLAAQQVAEMVRSGALTEEQADRLHAGPDDTTPPSAADDTQPPDPEQAGALYLAALVAGVPLAPGVYRIDQPIVMRPELTPDDCLDDDEPERTWPALGGSAR